MKESISISRRTIFLVIAMAAFVASVGLTYGNEIVSVFVRAPQNCPLGKCVYGFDAAGGILCRPCGSSSALKGCVWEKETPTINHVKEYNFQYDACKQGEEYAHGEICALSITETSQSCLYNGHWVNWKRATCRDGLWSEATEKYCKRV